MTRAVELLKNSFGVSQLYQHDVVKNGTLILSVYWHPLTIAERESITKKSDANVKISLNNGAFCLRIFQSYY